MTQQHSPEPWHYEQTCMGGGYNYFSFCDGENKCIMKPADYSRVRLRDVDAERLVTCVNACQGISNEDLLAGVVAKRRVNWTLKENYGNFRDD